jgi:hypothetical protein
MPVNRRSARRLEPLIWALLLLLGFCALGDHAQASDRPTILTVTEARILIYISPVAQIERQRGFDVGMERQNSRKLDQADYYYFWVYNAKREKPSGSVTIGYYAVNKHTGQVWDTDNKKEISSKLMRGVQAIIRRSHHADKATMERYGGKPF